MAFNLWQLISCHVQLCTVVVLSLARRDSPMLAFFLRMTSTSSTHLNPKKQCKPTNTVQAIPPQSYRTRRHPSEKQTSSHSNALDNTLPQSRERLGDFPLPRDQPRLITLHPSGTQKYDTTRLTEWETSSNDEKLRTSSTRERKHATSPPARVEPGTRHSRTPCDIDRDWSPGSGKSPGRPLE